MPDFYLEGDDPKLADPSGRSLHKINSLLKSIEAKTGSTTITGPVTVSNEVEVTNTTGNPIPISGTVALDATSLAALENISVTFTSGLGISQPVSLATAPTTPVTGTFWQATQPVSLASAPVTPITDNGGSLTVDGTVTANVSGTVPVSGTFWQTTQPISGTVDTGLTQPLTDTQLRETAIPVSGTFFQGTQPVSLASVPSHEVTGSGSFTAAQATASSLKAQAQILNSAGSLITYAETGTYGSPSVDVISVQNPQGVTATITTFTSTTASTSLVAAGSTRKALTVYNSGAGDLYISPTAVCTTTNFQLKLSSGDFWECPSSQVLLSHTGVFSIAGSTAYITSLT